MVAAYLSVCQDMNITVRYASAHMLLQMCDFCIRAYLAFMHEIFVEAGRPTDEFLKRLVPNDTQTNAIKRASRQKCETIAYRGVIAPTETGRLIDALAQITAVVQTQGSDKASGIGNTSDDPY
jgi:hypothetical protein